MLRLRHFFIRYGFYFFVDFHMLTSSEERQLIWENNVQCTYQNICNHFLYFHFLLDEFSIDSFGVIRTKKRVIVAGSKTFNLTLAASDSVCTVYSRAIIVIHLDTMFTVTPSKCPVYCPACPVCTGVPVTGTSAPSTCPSTCQACLSPSNYVFNRVFYSIMIQENTTYSNSILQVELRSASGNASFSIIEASALEYFKINGTTGRCSST